mmetsp:Transcript_19274/g.40488  ORF Transcript_19274/g.40488 Transcript_19274/m.40488 type:complete len:206 (+) Transcript_19274:826-1443(+)
MEGLSGPWTQNTMPDNKAPLKFHWQQTICSLLCRRLALSIGDKTHRKGRSPPACARHHRQHRPDLHFPKQLPRQMVCRSFPRGSDPQMRHEMQFPTKPTNRLLQYPRTCSMVLDTNASIVLHPWIPSDRNILLRSCISGVLDPNLSLPPPYSSKQVVVFASSRSQWICDCIIMIHRQTAKATREKAEISRFANEYRPVFATRTPV